MTTHATIAEALRALPTGPDAIAKHLAGLGIQAVCGSPHRCAIAEYLTQTVAGVTAVAVGRTQATGGGLDGASFAVMGRNDITEFIDRFDAGEYPSIRDGQRVSVTA